MGLTSSVTNTVLEEPSSAVVMTTRPIIVIDSLLLTKASVKIISKAKDLEALKIAAIFEVKEILKAKVESQGALPSVV